MENNITAQQKALIITKVLFDNNENMYATLSDKQKQEVFLKLLNDVTEKIINETEIIDGLEGGLFDDIIDWTSKAAEDAVKWSKQAAIDAANWTKNAAIDAVDWSKQAAVDSYDWGKNTAKWAACKTCTATISSFLNLSGTTIALNLLVFSMLNNEPDREKKNQKIDAAIDDVMNYLPKEINGVNIDKSVREKTKKMFILNLENNPADFVKMCKSGIQYVIATIVCQVTNMCKD